MKKLITLVLACIIIPVLYAAETDIVPTKIREKSLETGPDAPVDLSVPEKMVPIDGRGFGEILYTINTLAIGLDGPYGLTWDGTYLYVVSVITDSCYVVDPYIPEVVYGFPAPQTSPWGIAQEQNLWITEITTDEAYEYTHAGTATGNTFSCTPGGASWAADGSEWQGDGAVWFLVVSGTNKAYKFEIPTGTVIDSMGDPAWTYTSQRGITYDPFRDMFWIGGWNSDSVWEINPDGTPTGNTFPMDGCAGIAYDWQSTISPDPVLWVNLGTADQIVMVDVDVPWPWFWDFETGWQGWTHTNADTFPFAWDVIESGYKPTWTPPDAGDSTMWIDSDAAGTGVVVEDTALSPAVAPPANMAWLKYGLGYRNLSATSDSLSVGIITFSGGAWNPPEELRQYNDDFGPDWDSIDVSAYATADSVRIYFYYIGEYDWYAGFDNVGLYPAPSYDAACFEVFNPPPLDAVDAGDYDIIGRIHNMASTATFDVTANVYDTLDAWNPIFTNTVTLIDFPAGGDSLVNLGTATFAMDKVYYTEIYTELVGDIRPRNDTSSVYSKTYFEFGDVLFVLDAQTATGDYQLLGIEFDGTYFYVTGGNAGGQPNKVYVLDTLGTLIWALDQPVHSTSWGWRDIAWDGVYAGPDRVDTLYASVDPNVDAFGIDLAGGVLTFYGSYPGPADPNRGLAWKPDSAWFFTADFDDPCYKFSKTNPNINSVTNTYSVYGAAYDTDTIDGEWVWWHSQDDPGTGFDLQIEQMDPNTMVWTGLTFGYAPPTLFSGSAGGLCFYEGFRYKDVLFALVQGSPYDAIVGIFLRWHGVPGVEERPGDEAFVFGFAPHMQNPIKGHAAIGYMTTMSGKVSLRIYDAAGRLIRTLVNKHESAGAKTVFWNGRDALQRKVADGVYFLRLEAEDKTDTRKLIFVR